MRLQGQEAEGRTKGGQKGGQKRKEKRREEGRYEKGRRQGGERKIGKGVKEETGERKEGREAHVYVRK